MYNKKYSRVIEITSKMKAYRELDRMIVPVSNELDYDRELAEARNKKYSWT